MRTALCFLVAMAAMLALGMPAHAERRLALVVGNGDYIVGPLSTPVNDADLIAATLQSTGFEVTKHTDLGYREMQRAILQFGRDLAEAGGDAVGVVYYAGHGAQADGENYLIPVDADLTDQLDLEVQTVEVSTFLKSLNKAGNALNIVILNASRDNPFKAMRQSRSRGLAKVDPLPGMLLAFSTSPGNIALDGAGRNSPYTEALAKAILQPGLPVDQVFKQVRINVMASTGQQQVPWETSSLTDNFSFIPSSGTPTAVSETSTQQQRIKQESPKEAEIAFWTSIVNSSEPSFFESYLSAYPNGLFASFAEQRIASLNAEQAVKDSQNREAVARTLWESIKGSDDVNVLNALITQFPGTVSAELAAARIATLQGFTGEQQETTSTVGGGTQSTSPNVAENLFWQAIKNSSNKTDYQAYLTLYPDGTFAQEARERIENGYSPQVAALATGPNPHDGTYELKMVVVGRPYGDPWCQVGERGASSVTISDGGGEAQMVSSMGGMARFKFEVTRDGRMDVILRIDGVRGSFDSKLNISSGEDVSKFNAYNWCESDFTVTRAF